MECFRGAARQSTRTSPRGNPYLLTGQERLLLCRNWPEMMRAQPELFTTTWMKAVERSPSIKETFGIGDGQNPRDNPSFTRLTMAVEAFFHRLIVNWNLEEQKIEATCIELGGKHTSFIARGFHAIFWDVFMVCLMDTIENSDLRVPQSKRIRLVHAWQKLVHTVVEYMRDGYNRQQRAQTSNNSD